MTSDLPGAAPGTPPSGVGLRLRRRPAPPRPAGRSRTTLPLLNSSTGLAGLLFLGLINLLFAVWFIHALLLVQRPAPVAPPAMPRHAVVIGTPDPYDTWGPGR